MSSTVRFAHAARTLGDAARHHGLDVPTLRSPPRTPGAVRTIRRSATSVTISVEIRDRPWMQVLADCVDGIVVANRLSGQTEIRARTALWQALEDNDVMAA